MPLRLLQHLGRMHRCLHVFHVIWEMHSQKRSLARAQRQGVYTSN